MNNYYDTLILSGGSVKSISMLGSLQYCYDKKLIQNIKTFIGTSAGAIILYLLCIGYTPLEIIVYLCTNNIFGDVEYLDIVSMMNGGGAISFSKFQEHLEKLTIDKIGYLVTFKDIKENFNKNLIITTYNCTKQKTDYLSYETTPNLPCLIALRMTSSLPLIFDIFKYMDNYYIDGGVGDNFPITYEIKMEDEDKIQVKTHKLGIMIDIFDDNLIDPTNIIEYVYKILCIPLKENINNKLEKAKYIDIIKIKNNINPLNFRTNTKDKMELFSIGYNIAHSFFED